SATRAIPLGTQRVASRAATLRQSVTWNAQSPAELPWSHEASPSVQPTAGAAGTPATPHARLQSVSSAPPPPESVSSEQNEQPSFRTTLPSSHSSGPSTTPSPHSLVQSAEQPSPLDRLPSSHCSPGSRFPLPHRQQPRRSSRQSIVHRSSPPRSAGASQPAPPRSPPSHSSSPSRRPFPQKKQPDRSSWLQSSAQRSVPPSGQLAPPRSAPSHCSAGSFWPLPHRVHPDGSTVQSIRQAARPASNPSAWQPGRVGSVALLTAFAYPVAARARDVATAVGEVEPPAVRTAHRSTAVLAPG